MNEVFKLFGSMGLDTDPAEKGVKNIVGKAEDAGNKIEAIFKKAAVAIGTVFAIDKVIDFGKLSVNAAAEAEEFAGAFEQVFKGFEAEAEASMQNVTDTIKASEGRFKESFLQIAGFGKASGMDTAESIELSNRAIEAAADYAAMYGGTLEDTSESLQSFLKGNFANDAALGVSATEFTRNAKAVELYGAEFNELTETQKQWTLLAMVEAANEQSGAMGQAAREADSYANTMGELKNAWNEFLIIVGGPILKAVVPVIKSITQGVQWLTKVIVPAAKAVGEFFGKFDFKSILEDVIEFGQGAIEVFMEIAEYVLEFLDPLITYWENTFDTLKKLFNDLVRAFKLAMHGDWSGAFNTLKTAIGDALTSMGDNILTAWSGIWENVKSFITGIDWLDVASAVMTLLGNVLSAQISLIGDIGSTIYQWIADKVGSIKWDEVGSTIANAINTVIVASIALITTIGTSIRDWIFNALNADDWLSVGTKIGDFIIEAVSALVDFGTTIVAALWGFITGAFSDNSTDSGNLVGSTIVDAIVAGVTALAETIAGIAISIWNWISTAFGEIDWASLGGDIVEGIKAGIAGAWEGFMGYLSEKANQIKALFTNPFGSNESGTFQQESEGNNERGSGGRGNTRLNVSQAVNAGISRIKEVTGDIANVKLFEPSNIAFDSFNGSGRPFEEQQTSLNHLLMVSEEMANGINKLVNKDDGLYMDGYELAKRGTGYINQENSIRASRATRLRGLTT